MENNLIKDINVLSKIKTIKNISLGGNRITDFTILNNIELKQVDKNYEGYVGLMDNCILDYSSIKEWLDNYYAEFKKEIALDNFFYEGMKWHFNMQIKDTIYTESEKVKYTFFIMNYFDQFNNVDLRPACNILMFFKAIGGTGKYNVKKGILKCNYQGKKYLFNDFSKVVKIDGKKVNHLRWSKICVS